MGDEEDDELPLTDSTVDLLNSRIDALVAVFRDDKAYGTVKSAFEGWQEEDQWTDELDHAATTSRQIWACLIGVPDAFGSHTNAYIAGQQSGQMDRETAIQVLKFLFECCYTDKRSRDEIVAEMRSQQEYEHENEKNRKEMAKDKAAKEPPLYAAGDIFHIWEAYLSSSGEGPHFIVPSGSDTATTSSLTEKADITPEDPPDSEPEPDPAPATDVSKLWSFDCLYDCAVVTQPPLIRRICELGICIVDKEQNLADTLKTAVRLITTTARKAADNALRRIVIALHVADAHWVLGVLDIQPDSDSWSGELRFFDTTNMFIMVPSSDHLDAKDLGLSKLSVAHQRGVTQQHDMCSSGPIIAANGLDYLKFGKGMKKPALDRMYDYGARQLREEFLNTYNVGPSAGFGAQFPRQL